MLFFCLRLLFVSAQMKKRATCVALSLAVLGAVGFLSLPGLCSLVAGLGLFVAWMGSWTYLRVALHTIKRDLMYVTFRFPSYFSLPAPFLFSTFLHSFIASFKQVSACYQTSEIFHESSPAK